MSSNYQSYLDYLSSFADSHIMAVEAETTLYPLFTDIKNLIELYQNTISKFSNVQNELVTYIEKLNIDEKDFDYYQDLFKELLRVDGYLQELKKKQVPPSIMKQVQDFISQTYNNASLYDLENIEEKVLSYHNKSTEISQLEKNQRDIQAQNRKTIIIAIIVVIIIGLLVLKCSH